MSGPALQQDPEAIHKAAMTVAVRHTEDQIREAKRLYMKLFPDGGNQPAEAAIIQALAINYAAVKK